MPFSLFKWIPVPKYHLISTCNTWLWIPAREGRSDMWDWGWDRITWVAITDHQCRRDGFCSLGVEKSNKNFSTKDNLLTKGAARLLGCWQLWGWDEALKPAPSPLCIFCHSFRDICELALMSIWDTAWKENASKVIHSVQDGAKDPRSLYFQLPAATSLFTTSSFLSLLHARAKTGFLEALKAGCSNHCQQLSFRCLNSSQKSAGCK